MTDILTLDPEAVDSGEALGPVATPMRLYLIDGSGYIFRAFHALPPLTRKSDGMPLGAVAGFCNMLWKFLCEMKAEKPTHLAVIFDASEKTFRTKLYDQYKAHRPPPPEDLIPQFPLVREATRAFGVPALELDGYEADDLIATYAKQVAEAGGEVIIVSSDKDLMQLVSEQISMFDPMKALKIGRDQVIEKFGLGPERVVEIQALAGDSVDNVPGAPGIGVKTAVQLLTEFGDLDTLLERAHEIKQPKKRETLMAFADQVRLSRELVRLADDAPIPAPVESLTVREPEAEVLAAFLEAMEFRTLARRVAEGPHRPHDGRPDGSARRSADAASGGRRHRHRPYHLHLHPRSRDPGRLDRQGPRRRGDRLRHRDRRAVVLRRRAVRRLHRHHAGRGGLYSCRPL